MFVEKQKYYIGGKLSARWLPFLMHYFLSVSSENNRKHRIIYTYSHIFGNIVKNIEDIFKLLLSKLNKTARKFNKIRLLFSMF